ncbi:MAG: hypothetical protein RIT19_1703 [Verrucomicrobiota bacterium]|jgi:hypothetical protein
MSGNQAGFTLMDPSVTGVTFTHLLVGGAYFTNAVAHNGSGVALGDVDRAGRPDLYLCGIFWCPKVSNTTRWTRTRKTG